MQALFSVLYAVNNVANHRKTSLLLGLKEFTVYFIFELIASEQRSEDIMRPFLLERKGLGPPRNRLSQKLFEAYFLYF